MEVAVTTKDGKDTGRKVKLHKSIFGITPNDHAIYLDVKQYLANQRQGTHKAKERSEVVGSTKKIKRQKGTGTARAGSIKSPIFRGGGTVFGPRPRDYGFKLNKKLKKLARRSALSYKAKDKEIFVLEDISFEAPKTKDYALMLKQNKLEGTKTLFILPEADKNLMLSSRNIQKTRVLTAEQLNTYELVNAEKLVLFEGAIKRIEELLK